MSLLKTVDITKTYPMGKALLPVLRGVNVEVPAGQFLVILGASGSGKSTLLHILGGLDKPTSGSVLFDGRDISRFSSRQLDRYRNQSVGFVFQFYHLINELNVLENVLVPAMAQAGALRWLALRPAAVARAKQLLEQVGLSHRLRHKPYELSGGERQRVALARALINQPRLLLADEPTGNLDSKTGCGILDLLAALHRDGQTIVMVTHDARIAQRAQRVVRLVDGCLENVDKPL